MINFHRYPGEFEKKEPSPFVASGIVKWCAICGTHKPQTGGTLRNLFGGRHWVCAKHPKPDTKK